MSVVDSLFAFTAESLCQIQVLKANFSMNALDEQSEKSKTKYTQKYEQKQ